MSSTPSTPGPSRKLLGAILLSLLGCLAARPLHAQSSSREIGEDFLAHPETYVEVQDGVFIRNTTSSGHPLMPGELISAAYRFEMIYDSTSRVQYTFSECTRNGRRLRLLAWKDSHVHAASAEMMSDSSRTEAFAIVPGDTVGLYREWKWYNPKDHRQDTANFLSIDTLDYAIELVSAKSGSRIALLDSFGVLPRVMPGPPTFYGSRPIIAVVRYVAPSTAPVDTAFVRVRLHTRGDGLYLPIREDAITVGASYALEHGYWDGYLSLYGGSLGRRSAAELAHAIRPAPSLLSISNVTPTTVAIRFSAPPGNGSLQIAIYDAAGSLLFVPYSSLAVDGPQIVTYSFGSGGTYFIALQRAGALLGAEKITIAR